MKILSLFSGAGGMDLALCRVFPECTLVSVEKNPVYAETLSRNIPIHFPSVQHSVLVADVVEVDPQEFQLNYGPFDLVVGGPPCEDFTSSGLRRGIDGNTGSLVFSFARFVDALLPKAFLFENVPNLYWEFTETLSNLVGHFSESGYSVKSEVLCAADFGSCTKRQRLLVVGMLDEWMDFSFPPRTHRRHQETADLFSRLRDPVLLKDVIGDLVHAPEEAIANHKFAAHRAETIAKYDVMPPGTSGGRSFVFRAHIDKQCRALIAGTDKNCKAYIHPIHPREMTVREYARIHGFPDSWVFAGSRQNGLKQVANSLPAHLGVVVFKAISEALSVPMDEHPQLQDTASASAAAGGN